MTITAQMHDGTRLEFPEGTDPAVIQRTVQGLLAQRATQDAPTKVDVSAPKSGVVMGLRDPIDGLAQLFERAIGPDNATKLNKFNNWLSDKTGIVTKVPETPTGVSDLVESVNQKYDQQRRRDAQTVTGLITGQQPEPGFDWGRFVGNVANPINRIIPMGGAGTTAQVVSRAALQGGISGAAQPVVNGSSNYLADKALQVGLGVGGGAAGGYVGDKVINALGNKFATLRERPNFPAMLGGRGDMPVPVRVDMAIQNAAANEGFDLASIPGPIMEDIKRKVTTALNSGKTLDPRALLRDAQAKGVMGEDAGLLAGQASRDPQAFAGELDLRGIQGAGKPIADKLALQNERLIGSVNKLGAEHAPDAYDAGRVSLSSLKATDDRLSSEVSSAYSKFRNTSGATIDVPLQPLAQRMGEVLDTFGAENLPSQVVAKLNSYGLGGTKQTKVFDLLEADKLIKTINANYDPMKAPQATALGSLRKGLQESIDLAGQQSEGATGPAADLLREALSKAKARFSLHESVPGLEAAAKDTATQEQFIRKYITSQTAGIDTVEGLTRLLSPDALKSVQQNVLASILERAAPGATRGSDTAKFSQSGFNAALKEIGDRKIAILFGQEGLRKLRSIGQVAEWIQKQPTGSAVNNSNSGSAVMNLLQGMSGKTSNPVVNKIMSMPGMNVIRNSAKESLDDASVRNALAPTVSPTSPNLTPEEINALRRFLPLAGGALGSSIGNASGQN